MVDSKKLCEMDNIITGLKIASENASYVVQDVMDEYFSLANEHDRDFYFNQGLVKNRIALDYILEVENLLEKLAPIFNAVFEAEKAEKVRGGV